MATRARTITTACVSPHSPRRASRISLLLILSQALWPRYRLSFTFPLCQPLFKLNRFPTLHFLLLNLAAPRNCVSRNIEARLPSGKLRHVWFFAMNIIMRNALWRNYFVKVFFSGCFNRLFHFEIFYNRTKFFISIVNLFLESRLNRQAYKSMLETVLFSYIYVYIYIRNLINPETFINILEIQ